MKEQQHYIFPTEGLTQEGDEWLGDFTLWRSALAGIPIENFAVIRRPAPSPRWIPASERWPTQEDTDENEEVLWAWWDTKLNKARECKAIYHETYWPDNCQNIHWHPLPITAIPPDLSPKPEDGKGEA